MERKGKEKHSGKRKWLYGLILSLFFLALIAIVIPAYFYVYNGACEKAVSYHIYNIALPIKKSIEEAWFISKKLPSSVEELSVSLPNMPKGTIFDIKKGGHITFHLGDGCKEYKGKSIYLVPKLKDGHKLNWQCFTNIENQSQCSIQ